MAARHPALTKFGLNLKRTRDERKLSQKKLVENADIDPTYISGIERSVRNPSVLSIVPFITAKLCKGVDL